MTAAQFILVAGLAFCLGWWLGRFMFSRWITGHLKEINDTMEAMHLQNLAMEELHEAQMDAVTTKGSDD